ncbi:MAG: protein kinase, partial [Myxococcales bacterium]|nr:protein kinase [Myxococcales bacterium]
MESTLPHLVARLSDRRTLAEIVRAALRHETVHVALEKAPARPGTHALSLEVGGSAVSLLAEPAGIPRGNAYPLTVRPMHRAHAAQLYALLEQEQVEALSSPGGPTTTRSGPPPQMVGDEHPSLPPDAFSDTLAVPMSGPDAPTSRAIIAPPSGADAPDPSHASLSLSVVFDPDADVPNGSLATDPSLSVSVVFENSVSIVVDDEPPPAVAIPEIPSLPPPVLTSAPPPPPKEGAEEDLVAMPDIPEFPSLDLFATELPGPETVATPPPEPEPEPEPEAAAPEPPPATTAEPASAMPDSDDDDSVTLVRMPEGSPGPSRAPTPTPAIDSMSQAPKGRKKKTTTRGPKPARRNTKTGSKSERIDAEASAALELARGIDIASGGELTPTSGRDPLVGRDIAQGKYTIDSLIGSGAAGAVYKARHRDLRRTVAIKVLHPHYQNDVGFMKRFHGEALAASQLDHPNIMRVLDFGQESDGLVYIVMEFLQGRTLQSLLDEERRISKERAAEILVQVCAALSVAHDNGIVHRDIKPDNIVLVPSRDDEGNTFELVKVCDFGIASLQNRQDDAEMQLGLGVICGTPEYMSPEQGRGDAVDARTDIYACGITLYELVTGRPPFVSENPVETLLKHARETPPPPSKLLRNIDPLLEEVILRAIQKDPADRQQSARELRLELKELLEPESARESEREPMRGAERTVGLDDPASGFQGFFIALASAVLEMGHFQKDHPESGQAYKHLKRSALAALRGRGEITFARRDTSKSVGFFVLSGPDGEIVDLKRLLGSQLHGMYGTAFIQALAKRSIAALTIREDVPETELMAALDLLRLPSQPAQLHARFAERNMRSVSVLFPQDVLGRDRRLSWTVGLCIARLARDLVLLANARGMSLKKVREHRSLLVREVVSLLGKPDDLRQFLGNADLVDSTVTQARGLASFSLSELVLEQLPQAKCVATLTLLVAEHDARRGAEAADRPLEPLMRALGARLVHERTPASDDMLRELHRRGIMAERELPPDLVARIRSAALADTLARDPTPFLHALDAIVAPADYGREVGYLQTAMATLAKRGEAPALLTTITTLARHAKGAGGKPGPREELALRAMKTVIDRDRLIPIANVLLRGQPQLRDPARAIIVLAGSAGAAALFAAREQVREPSARPIFVATFRDTGAAGWPLLSAALARMDPSREDFDAA